jgi:hypothetical protein
LRYRRGRLEGAGRAQHSPRSGVGSHGSLGYVGACARVGSDPEKRPGADPKRAIKSKCALSHFG